MNAISSPRFYFLGYHLEYNKEYKNSFKKYYAKSKWQAQRNLEIICKNYRIKILCLYSISIPEKDMEVRTEKFSFDGKTELL